MNIYKDDFDTQSILESAIEKAESDHITWATVLGTPAPSIHPIIRRIRNGEAWTFIDKTKEEVEIDENAQEQADAEAALIVEYQTDTEKWRTEKVKPWSVEKLKEWIDITFLRPLQYELDSTQAQERVSKRNELLVYHNMTSYMTDDELEAVKPDPPSYL